jgi:methionyl-tRNA synthetase
MSERHHDEDRRFPTDEPAVVTCGLPYANGDLHVGHLRNYVSGDVLTRALRSVGQQTAFVCGSDMHGTPVAVNAEQEGRDPEAFALEWHEQYERQFPRFDVDFDNYGHTHDETNTELTREIVRALQREGHVVEQEVRVAWDPEIDQPLPDRYVEGTCPHCGELARGDECDEGCGRHLEPGEIEDPVSVVTGEPAEYRLREHEFFRLADLQEYLQEFIDRLEGTDNAREQPREWIFGALEDWCITRDMDWGIDYPDADGDRDDLVLYVWVDAPVEYIASTKQYSERVGRDEYDWRAVWGAGPAGDDSSGRGGGETSGDASSDRGRRGDIVHVIGQDIIQHHTVFWPAMLRAAGYNEPRAVVACGWVTIDGKGLSTSRGRAVWADEYLAAGFDPDLLRYYLTTAGGFQDNVDFSWERFRQRVNDELVDDLGNFIYRSLLFAHRNYGGTPDEAASEDVRAEIKAAIEQFRDGLDDYEVRDVGDAAVDLARFGNAYIQNNEPWNLDDDEAAAVIRDCVQIAKAVCVLAEPVLPNTAAHVWDTLGEPGSVHETTLDAALEAPPAEFAEPEEPFDPVEAPHVADLAADLEERVAEGSDEPEDADDDAAAPDLQPLAEERIGHDQFQRLDMRVGRIESAEPIAGADELLRLEVDVGVEIRQIVAGLRQLHDAADLPGTRVVVLVNLEPTELFGVKSNGMVLAAGDEADLLTTHGDAPLGETVR